MLPFLLLLLSVAAQAHAVDVPKNDVVRVDPQSISVAVDYIVAPAEASDLRTVYDANRDGRIEGAERDAFAKWLLIAATRFVEVKVDGKKVPLSEDEPNRTIEGLEAKTASSAEIRASFVLRAKLPLSAGEHRLELRDRHKDATIPVPVRVALVGGLVASKGTATEAVFDSSSTLLAVVFSAP